jgi:tetratricopeptide (TPR) repeat protein
MKKYIIIFLLGVALIGGGYAYQHRNDGALDQGVYENEAIQQLLTEYKDSGDTEALFKLALEYHKINEFGKAVRVYDDLIDQLPDNPLYKLNKADSLFNKGDLNATAALLEEVIASNTKQMQAYPTLIDIYNDLGNDDGLRTLASRLEAVLEEPEAVFINNEDDSAVVYLQRVYDALDDYENLLRVYEQLRERGLVDEAIIEADIADIKEKMNK